MRTLPILLLAACSAGQRFQTPPEVSMEDLLPEPQIDGWSVGAQLAVAFDAQPDVYTIASSDPGVAEMDFIYVSEAGVITAFLDAVGPGSADAVLYENTVEVERIAFDVRTPDHVEWHPSAAVFTEIEEPANLPLVLIDGVAAFEVRWFSEDGERLHPPPWSASGDNGMWVQTWATHHRHWVRVTPQLEGVRVVTLRHGDGTFAEWMLDARQAQDIASVDLVDVETAADARALLAIPRAQGGTPIWGAEFEWAVRGRPVAATGDLYLYDPDPEVDVPIEAAIGDVSASGRLRGTGGPWSSADVGCSSLGGAGLGLVWLLPAVAAARRRHPRA